MNEKTIAIATPKRGVGKTTTYANLGIELALEYKKVLLIEAPSQGSLSISLGHPRSSRRVSTFSTITIM